MRLGSAGFLALLVFTQRPSVCFVSLAAFFASSAPSLLGGSRLVRSQYDRNTSGHPVAGSAFLLPWGSSCAFRLRVFASVRLVARPPFFQATSGTCFLVRCACLFSQFAALEFALFLRCMTCPTQSECKMEMKVFKVSD